MKLVTDENEELDSLAPCGALTAMLLIAGLMTSATLIAAVAVFRFLRR